MRAFPIMFALALHGCAVRYPLRMETREGFAWKVRAWEGASSDELVETLGAPDRTFNQPGRGTIYIYNSQRIEFAPRVTVGGGWSGLHSSVTTGGEPIIRRCQVMLEVLDRRVVWSKFEGNDCFAFAPASLGVVVEPWVGTDERRRPETGAVVRFVMPDSTAEEAGLVPGDIIHSLDGVRVSDAPTLNSRVDAYGTGSFSKVVFWREGRRQSTEVQFGPPPLPRR